MDSEDNARTFAVRAPWLVAGAFSVVGVTVALFANLVRVQDFDPQYVRNIVERIEAYGGTIYENGIHNKGPLEPFVYWAARQVSSYDGFWYVISFFVALSALVLAITAAKTAHTTGARTDLAIGVGVVVFVHFTMSGADYAGVLYARNITVTMLATVWLAMLLDAAWSTPRRRLATAVASGALLGLAVQTLLPTAFSATAVWASVLALLWTRVARDEWARLGAALSGAAGLAFVSAPLWYAARGSFTPFWSGWWTHARYMNVGTGRSLGSQLGLGWDQLYAYYQQRPIAFGIVVASVALTVSQWQRWDLRTRAVHVGLLGWFAASWIELVLSQRYSSHYFSISSVPTALLAATLVGAVTRALLESPRPRARALVAVPVLAGIAAVYLSGPQYFEQGVRTLRDFEGVHERAERVEASSLGPERSVYAMLDAVSEDGDPLLAWTNDPWPHLRWHRVSATRFLWKSFLLGEIYLGRSSPDYVLDDTWTWFRDDLEESDPRAFVEVNATIVPGTEFAGVVARDFRLVYPGEHPVYLRNDVADEVLRPSAERPWEPPTPPAAGSGWTQRGTTLAYTDAPDARRDAGTLLLGGSCTRIDGVIDSDGEGFGTVVFRLDDVVTGTGRLRLAFEGARVVSGTDFSAFEEVPSDLTEPGPVPFSLVIGARSALLVVNDAVRAAVRLPGEVATSVEPHSRSVVLRDLRVGDAPSVSGC